MNWMRLYAEFATDPKVQMMSEAMQRRLVMLFCLKCGNGIETFHETERDVSLAFALRISPEETAATKAEFVRRGFINSDWTVRNWNKRQYASDSSTARVRKHRDGRKQGETEQGNNAKRFSNAPEQNRTEQNRAEKKEQKKKATPPATPAALPEVPEWVPVDAWTGFVDMRRRERHPLTPRAAKLVLSELDKLRAAGHEPGAVLDQSTRNGWRDVFAIKADRKLAVVGGGGYQPLPGEI